MTELLKRIRGHLEFLMDCSIEERSVRNSTQKLINEINAIANKPISNAEPVKHGEWVETEPDEDDRKIGIEFSIKCSRCHDENSHLDFNENHEIIGKTFWKSRFCPNCGAKMDGGSENGLN